MDKVIIVITLTAELLKEMSNYIYKHVVNKGLTKNTLRDMVVSLQLGLIHRVVVCLLKSKHVAKASPS